MLFSVSVSKECCFKYLWAKVRNIDKKKTIKITILLHFVILIVFSFFLPHFIGGCL